MSSHIKYFVREAGEFHKSFFENPYSHEKYRKRIKQLDRAHRQRERLKAFKLLVVDMVAVPMINAAVFLIRFLRINKF